MIICNPGIKPTNRHLQSMLASSKIRLIRLRHHNPIAKHAKEVFLESKYAKLQGYINQNKKEENLYILLHGWEGSAHSTYIQLLAHSLNTIKQASVFRLNFRDHGDTHHLNKGLFHSCRLDEVVAAVEEVIKRYPHKSVYLCGFSLGANFSLRVAAKAYTQGFSLKKVFAISPPLVPKNSMLAIESSKLYSSYFLKKWQKSLVKKNIAFPQYFENKQYRQIKSLEKLTENLIIEHTRYNSTDEYFKGYEITEEVFGNITSDCEIITAWDDPVIPFADFNRAEKKKHIKLVTTKHGGHCGFINSWKMHSWIEKHIIENS